MPGDEIHLGTVDQDLVLRGLEAQNVGDMLGRDGVMVCLKLNEPVWSTDAQRHFGAVIGMKGQGLKRLLGKELQGSVPGRVVKMEIGLLFEPPSGSGPEIVEILEVSSIEQIAFHVLERCLDLSLRFRSPLSARNGLASVMRDEGRKCRIEDGSATFPSEHHGLLVIIKTLSGHSSKMLEGVLMSSDQTVEVMMSRKVDVLTPGEAQDIGEALHQGLTATGEGDRVGTPIHLSLLPGFRLKPYHRFSIREPQFLDPLPQNADPPGITHFLQLLIDSNARDLGVFVQQLCNLRVKCVEFARPCESFGQYLMAAVPPLGMGPENPPHRVAP